MKHVHPASRAYRLAARPTESRIAPSGRIRALRPPRAEYDRRTALAKVLALWPHEIEDESREGRAHILARLRRALRAERQRGLAGHWTYDLARHAELLRVYKQELLELAGDKPPAPAERR